MFYPKVNSGGTDRSSKDRRGLRPPDRPGPDGAGQEGEDGDREEAPEDVARKGQPGDGGLAHIKYSITGHRGLFSADIPWDG